MIKQNKLSLIQQYSKVKIDYPSGDIKLINHNAFEWKGYLRSSPIGDMYTIKIVYKKDSRPNVFVLEPKKLKLADGKLKLEHVYDQETQRLCLYYPKAKEWNESMWISKTIFPWTIEWLFHYEIWLITGEWEGGGIHLGIPKT